MEYSDSVHPAWRDLNIPSGILSWDLIAATENYDVSAALADHDEEESEDSRDVRELRPTRLADGQTLILVIALITQMVVLAGIAIIMGVAVVTMCAVVGELFVIIAVATIMERQLFTFSELANLLEMSITVFVTLLTITIAVISSSAKITDFSSIAASKLG